jgi:hypothetical protein
LTWGHVKYAMTRGLDGGLASLKGQGACRMRLCPVGPRKMRKESDDKMKTEAMGMFALLMFSFSILAFVYVH